MDPPRAATRHPAGRDRRRQARRRKNHPRSVFLHTWGGAAVYSSEDLDRHAKGDVLSRLAAIVLGTGDPAGAAELEPLLAELYADARDAWPGVILDDESFVAHLAGCVAREGPDVGPALRALHTRDLYLACACARGAPGAMAVFERHLLSRLPAHLASLRLDRAALEDARQAVCQRLLVSRPDGPPRIAAYAGRGPLEGWLRIAAIRCVLDAREHERARAQVEEHTAALLPSAADAEMAIVRERHRADLALALREALGELSARERTLLGLHFLQGMHTGKLATMYGVHRTTVGRWIDTARETLLQTTRRKLAARLRLNDLECDSLIALLASQLHLTLGGLLDPPAS